MVSEELAIVCLDASIVAKFLFKEKDSPQAALLFERLFEKDFRIIEPNFLRVEVYSVARKKAFFEKITERQVKTALALFEELGFDYFKEDNELLNSAYQLAHKLKQPVIYDCLYLALAKREEAIFITADLKFLKMAKTVWLKSFSLTNFQVFL